MLTRRAGTAVWLVLLAAVLAAGIVELLRLRFAVGDVYPPYSSLRSDPLGAKAFHDSLAGLGGVTVRRHYRDAHKLAAGGEATLFFLGTSVGATRRVPLAEVRALEQFMFGGGRVVVAFSPLNTQPWADRREAERKKKETGKKRTDPETPGPDKESEKRSESAGEDVKEQAREKKRRADRLDPDTEDAYVGRWENLHERWGVRFNYEALRLDRDTGIYEGVPVRRQTDAALLPETAGWHSALYFTELKGEWRPVYVRAEAKPVVIERRFGRGSLVLASDSYLFSNEALRNERQPALLAWFTGPAGSVVFDEHHLGVKEQPGVASLMRKYRLHGVVGGFLLLALLFVWKNATSLVPPRDDDAPVLATDQVEGRDAASGFVNLLRRGIGGGDIAGVCFEEWKRARAGDGRWADKTARMQAVLDGEKLRSKREQNPVAVYHELSRIVAERKT
jgi:hypothetical protein